MRQETQNGGAKASLLPTRGAKASTKRLPKCESKLVIAIQGSQFQKDEVAEAKAGQQSRWQAPRNAICDSNFAPVACPASEARKDRVRTVERTNRNCIAH